MGIDLWTKVVKIDDRKVKAVIYDTSGQERFRSIPKGYIRKGDGIVVVYDITDRATFDSTMYWINEIECLRDDKPPIIILGNKADLDEQRRVQYKEGKALADKFGVFFAETSIKDQTSIDQAFQILIKTTYIKQFESNTKKPKEIKKKRTLHKGHYESHITDSPTCGSKKCQ